MSNLIADLIVAAAYQQCAALTLEQRRVALELWAHRYGLSIPARVWRGAGGSGAS